MTSQQILKQLTLLVLDMYIIFTCTIVAVITRKPRTVVKSAHKENMSAMNKTHVSCKPVY